MLTLRLLKINYVYLGIPFVINGSFMPALKQLIGKAFKANMNYST